MVGKGIRPKTFIEAGMAIGTALIGVLIFWWAYLGQVYYGEGVNAMWSKRILVFIGITLMSGGSFFVMNTWKRRIVTFIVSFLSLAAVLVILGGTMGFFDATRTGDRQTVQDAWIAFDANYALGINFVLIADAMSALLPWIFFALVIYQVLYAGEADEQMKSIMEGGIVMGFMWVFAVLIYPNFV